jgi:hypothetical protein
MVACSYFASHLWCWVRFFIATSGPRNQGWDALIPIFFGLLVGCVRSCLVSILSAIKRERFFGIALLAGIPSLIFIVKVCVAIPQGAKDAKRQNESIAAHYKHEEETIAQIKKFSDEFSSTPSLITNDDFWQSQKSDRGKSAMYGLIGVLQDKSFEVTPQIKAYVISNFQD